MREHAPHSLLKLHPERISSLCPKLQLHQIIKGSERTGKLQLSLSRMHPWVPPERTFPLGNWASVTPCDSSLDPRTLFPGSSLTRMLSASSQANQVLPGASVQGPCWVGETSFLVPRSLGCCSSLSGYLDTQQIKDDQNQEFR